MLRTDITKSDLNNRICQHRGLKTSTVTASYNCWYNSSRVYEVSSKIYGGFFLPGNHLNCLVITKVYRGIQTYRLSLSSLTIFFPFNCSIITKIYSGVQTYRRSVSLSPLTIIFFPFNCLVITKVYSGIQTYRQSVLL